MFSLPGAENFKALDFYLKCMFAPIILQPPPSIQNFLDGRAMVALILLIMKNMLLIYSNRHWLNQDFWERHRDIQKQKMKYKRKIKLK